MKRTHLTLVAGELSEKTEAWLKAHNAAITYPEGIVLVKLNRKVDYAEGPYRNTYTIGVYGPDGNEEDEYLYYAQHIDVHECELEVKGPEDRL
jgi:hypothetical protein